jgi:pilus assembly protein CpaB
MKQQRVATALVASLVISGACTFLLAHTINHQAAPKGIPDLMYAAPSRALQAGEIVKPDCIQLVAWPGNKPLRGAFSKADAVFGRAVLFPLEKGEPILDRDVSAVGVGAGLAGKIPDGMRAIALRSDEVVGVAGFLTPGSHVDVLGTFRSAASPDPITATVLENAEVLAVGQRAQPDPEGKPAPAVTVVTLLLTPEEAERAVLASSQGSVHFVLRNGADDDRHKSSPMMMSMLSGLQPVGKPVSESAAPAPAPAHIPAAKPQPQIETVLGGGATSKPEGGTQP